MWSTWSSLILELLHVLRNVGVTRVQDTLAAEANSNKSEIRDERRNF